MAQGEQQESGKSVESEEGHKVASGSAESGHRYDKAQLGRG